MLNECLLPNETGVFHLLNRRPDLLHDYLANLIKISEIIITDMLHLLALHECEIFLENVNRLDKLGLYFLLDYSLHILVRDRVFILF